MTDSATSTPLSRISEIVRQTLKRAKEGHLPASRQFAEMLILYLFYGLGPGHYHVTRYWRRELSWQFKTGFWTYKKFRRFIRTINPLDYQKMSQHKISEKAILQLLGVPTPQFLGRLHHRYGVTAEGEAFCDANGLEALLRSTPDLDRVCFKLVEGYGGTGFRAVSVERGSNVILTILDTGARMSSQEFVNNVLRLDSRSDYIVEQYIRQHSELARFNESSVNTLRIWALSHSGGSAILGAFLRVGRSGAMVDNTSQGGLAFPVDIQSGRIGTGLIKSIESEAFEHHKDTGELISGRVVPFWRESAHLAIRAVQAIPRLQFAGVDVAITVDGPVVIELNVEPDPTSAVIFDQSHDDLFGPHFHR